MKRSRRHAVLHCGTLVTSGLAVACLLMACGPRHIRAFSPRERQWEQPEYAQQESKRAPGSLWSEADPSLFEDARARRVGDTVVIVLDENTTARGDASTSLGRDSSSEMSIAGLFGLLKALQRAVPDLDTENLLNYDSAAEFEGDGSTVRNNKLQGRIAVHVQRRLPNGDLYIEGNKVVLVNNEELHIYVSGVIRPVDVAGDNTVPSSRIADAQVELGGRGDLSNYQRPGWLSRIINRVNPL